VNFLDRVLSGAGLFMHIMLSNAVLSDLFEGQELAEIRVVKQSMFAAGLVAGPLVGNLLAKYSSRGPITAFLPYAPIPAAISVAILWQLPETLLPAMRCGSLRVNVA
jgi:hypothetical protein